jgi:hypothetical protein
MHPAGRASRFLMNSLSAFAIAEQAEAEEASDEGVPWTACS